MTQKIKETIKTFILIVLFLAAILFLYLLWPDKGFSLIGSSSIDDEQVTKVYELYELITPNEVCVRQQGNSVEYIKSKSLVFQKAMDKIKNMCAENETAIASITPEMYDEAKNNFQSLSISFNYGISFSDIANYIDLKTGSNFDIIKEFDTIMYSSAYKSSVFFRNSHTGESFRLAGKNFNLSIEDILLDAETDGNKYIQAKQIMGQGENFIPYGVSNKVKVSAISTKVLSDTESENLARILFGKSFDFARKVVDTVGNITYMYGYGQKVLKINKAGDMEYRAELSEKKKNSVIEDLAVANEFVEALSLENISGLEFLLSDITISEEDSSIRRFEYSQYRNGIIIKTSQDSAALLIEVQNGQIINFVQNAITAGSESDNGSLVIYEPARMLAENCMDIYETVNGMAARNEEEAYSFVCENVEAITVVYLKEINRIAPNWAVHIAGETLYYNYY